MRFWGTAVAILVIDQLSKWWVNQSMAFGDSIEIINGIFSITYIHNRGAAFGILQGKAWFFLIMAVIVSAVLIYYNYKHTPQAGLQYAMGLIVGGTMGNVIDRWFYGFVRDFFSIGWWPVFNVADMAIVGGGSLMMLLVFLYDNLEMKL